MNKEIKIIRIVRLNSNQNQIQPILKCHYWKQMLNHCMNSQPTDKSIVRQGASHCCNLKAVICACAVLSYLLQCSCSLRWLQLVVSCYFLSQWQHNYKWCEKCQNYYHAKLFHPPLLSLKPVWNSLINEIWSFFNLFSFFQEYLDVHKMTLRRQNCFECSQRIFMFLNIKYKHTIMQQS